jgi:hypothetical protein
MCYLIQDSKHIENGLSTQKANLNSLIHAVKEGYETKAIEETISTITLKTTIEK